MSIVVTNVNISRLGRLLLRQIKTNGQQYLEKKEFWWNEKTLSAIKEDSSTIKHEENVPKKILIKKKETVIKTIRADLKDSIEVLLEIS